MLWSWCPELHETRGGARVAFSFSANAGGNALRATYLRQTRGGKGFFCPFFGVFGSSVPFLFFLRGGLPKRKQQKQQEQRNLDQKKQRNKDEKKRKKKKKKEKKKQKKMMMKKKKKKDKIRRRRRRRRKIRRTKVRRRWKDRKGSTEGKKTEK